MSSSPAQPLDFFISHSGHDRDWAEWIGHQLVAHEYRVTLDVWDWSAGTNFVLEMDKATRLAERTIVVLSDHYLNGVYTNPEWAVAFVRDPTGANRAIIPVRVLPCVPTGLLAPLVYIDLVGLDEAAAERALVDGVRPNRAPRTTSPPFPGGS